jgi:hypothetical protein
MACKKRWVRFGEQRLLGESSSLVDKTSLVR